MDEDFYAPRALGRTGLSAGRLGVACSYGAPTEAFEEAFERGVNYFYWGSSRKEAMARAIRNLVGRGQRDRLIVVLQSYSRSAVLMEALFRRGLRTLGLEFADVLLLGWHNKPPSPRLLDRARSMRERGMFRFLALSGHNRPLFPILADTPDFDLFHVRYNAAHRGAESEVFGSLPPTGRPGLVTYTATRWGDLLRSKTMPPGEPPLRGADCSGPSGRRRLHDRSPDHGRNARGPGRPGPGAVVSGRTGPNPADRGFCPRPP